MKLLLWVLAAAIIAVGVALMFAPRVEVRTEVRIDAQPDTVWTVLATPENYPEWNPFLVRMEGNLVEGQTLTNTMRPADGADMTFRPTVLTVRPHEELRWLGRLFVPRLFDGEHYFLLEEQEGGTRLVHGEVFHGIGLWFLDVEQFRKDFEAMNAALKARAEAMRP